jgi:DNA-binding GntR family transcriptional regulator
VRHAMSVLRERGVIITVHGRGTFVNPHEPGTDLGSR